MGYSELTGGLSDFSKAVISIWFEIPASVLGSDPSARGSRDTLAYTIPLTTFGRRQTFSDYEPNTVDVAVAGDAFAPPVYNSTTTYTLAGTSDMDPCYIGVVVPLSGDPFLRFNLQLETFAVQSNVAWSVTTETTFSHGEDPYTGPDDLSPGSGNETITTESGVWTGTSTLSDLSAFINEISPETFMVNTIQPITADTWHHLLLSFDLSTGCSTEAGHGTVADGTTVFSKLWYAIDDVNYNGEDNLGPYFVDGGADNNAILTNNAYSIASSLNNLIGNRVVTAATCELSSGSIPSASASLGIPVSADFATLNEVVRFSDIQIFTGVSIDTSVEDNRRAFRTSDGKPASPLLAQALLGKTPEVLRQVGWMAGTNSGTAGSFDVTGTVSSFTPGPSS